MQGVNADMQPPSQGRFRRSVTRLVLPVVIVGMMGMCDFLWGHSFNKRYAEAYLNESILLAAGTYATCRAINAGVSSLQESSVSVSPWGVGIQYQVGQLLDPINDATERLSDICVKSMGLLSAQRLAVFAVNQYTVIPFYIAALLALAAFYGPYFVKAAVPLGKIALLLLLIRMAIPGMCWIGKSIDVHYFSPKMQIQLDDLSQVKRIALDEFDETTAAITIEPDGSPGDTQAPGFLWGFGTGIGRYYEAVKHRAEAIKAALAYFRTHFDQIAESLTMLFVLFLEKIVVQVFALPILTYLVIRKLYGLVSGDRLDAQMERIRQSVTSSGRSGGRIPSAD